MTTTPPLSPASRLRGLLLRENEPSERKRPTSPRSTVETTQHGGIKRRLTTARLLALPRKPPGTVKTAATLDAVISSGITGPARIMAEMRLRGYEVEKDVVQRAVKKWKTRAKTVARLEKQGIVAGKRLAGKSVIPKVEEEEGEGEVERMLPAVCTEWPTLQDDAGESLPSPASVPAPTTTDEEFEIGDWDWLSVYFA